MTTTAEPLPLAESNRSVEVILPREAPVGTDSVVDLLRTDPSLNLQARAGEGVQADLSIRGTTFEQSLVLVNGLRVDDPETGHLNLDIPVPLDAITRVDVLHGSGSTFYGSDAIGGAVNLLTGAPGAGLSVVARSGAGNYGSLENHLRAAYSAGPFAEQLTGSRDTSDGFIADRNYSSNALASESWLKTKPGTTDILLAASDRPYGANHFYGPYDSWERTKAWLASIQQQLGARTAASFGYRRHSDLFVLLAGPSRNLREQPHHHQLRGRAAPGRRAGPQHHARLRAGGVRRLHPQLQLLRRSPQQRARRPCAQPGRGLRQPQPALARALLALPRRARGGSLGRGFGLLAQRGRGLYADQNASPARIGGTRISPAHLHRSLLLRPGDAGQSRPEAGVELELPRAASTGSPPTAGSR